MLRLIAIISMTVDHAALLLIDYGIMPTLSAGSENYLMWDAICTALRTIGRMAFPIFALFIVQGYERTKNFRNYALRLLGLALVSEFFFDRVVTGYPEADFTYQNTVFTLLIALLTLKAANTLYLYLQRRSLTRGKGELAAGKSSTAAYFGVWLIVSAAGCLAAQLIGSDYGWEGVALIVFLYLCRGDKALQCVVGALWCIIEIMDFRFPYVLGYAVAFILIYIFRDRPPIFRELREKWRIAMMWAEYLYYPVHLMILWEIYSACFLK